MRPVPEEPVRVDEHVRRGHGTDRPFHAEAEGLGARLAMGPLASAPIAVPEEAAKDPLALAPRLDRSDGG